MPLYSYICTKCDAEKEESLPYEDRHDPLNSPCWNCGKQGYVEQRFRMNISVDTHATHKIDGGMRDVLRGIKKANKGSTIDVD